jgi:hypothetical protein
MRKWDPEWEWANALAGDSEDAEGFAVYCVASSEDLVEHTRQCDWLVSPVEVRVV